MKLNYEALNTLLEHKHIFKLFFLLYDSIAKYFIRNTHTLYTHTNTDQPTLTNKKKAVTINKHMNL